MSYTESWSGKINRKLLKKLHIIDVAVDRLQKRESEEAAV